MELFTSAKAPFKEGMIQLLKKAKDSDNVILLGFEEGLPSVLMSAETYNNIVLLEYQVDIKDVEEKTQQLIEKAKVTIDADESVEN